MPVYNSEGFVGPAIESIFLQTYRDIELIVVDDGSEDGTWNVIERLQAQSPIPFRAIRHDKNMGVSAAKNSGIERSSGKYLAFAAGDDLQKPNRIERTVKELDAGSDLDMVFFDCDMIDEEGRPLNRRKGYPQGMDSHNALLFQLKRNHLLSGLVLLRNSPDVYFDPELPNAVDYELFLRLLIKGYNLKIIEDSLMYYRLHRSNISGDGRKSKQSVVKILSRLDLEQLLSSLSERFGDAEARVAVASAALSADKPLEALKFLKSFSYGTDPLSLEARFILGVSLHRIGDYSGSLQAFREIVSYNPGEAAAFNNLGVQLALMKQIDQSKAYFNQALLLREDYLDAQHNLKQLEDGNKDALRVTEKPLRPTFIHTVNYRL